MLSNPSSSFSPSLTVNTNSCCVSKSTKKIYKSIFFNFFFFYSNLSATFLIWSLTTIGECKTWTFWSGLLDLWVHAELLLCGDKKVRNARWNGLRVQPEGAVVLIGHCHSLRLPFPCCLLYSAIALCGLSGTENNSETVWWIWCDMIHYDVCFFLKFLCHYGTCDCFMRFFRCKK